MEKEKRRRRKRYKLWDILHHSLLINFERKGLYKRQRKNINYVIYIIKSQSNEYCLLKINYYWFTLFMIILEKH